MSALAGEPAPLTSAGAAAVPAPAGERPALARVSAVFELRGSGRDGVARSAAELVDALQQFAATPGRECDLDVSLDVQAAASGR
ncbi:MAG: hypothetical protein ACYCU0_10770 [Solirubrobacteraceae bacterium]